MEALRPSPFQPSDLKPSFSPAKIRVQDTCKLRCGPRACGASLFHRISGSSLLRAQKGLMSQVVWRALKELVNREEGQPLALRESPSWDSVQWSSCRVATV